MKQLFVLDPACDSVAAPRRAQVVAPKINAKSLERYCWHHLSLNDVDLVLVLHAVAYADRIFTRTRAIRWARDLELLVPVHDISLWNGISTQLSSMLEFLTGDVWRFVFRARSKADTGALHLDLQKPLRDPAGLPFSGGLDSFALARMLEDRTSRDLIMVSAQHASLSSWRSLGVALVGHEARRSKRQPPCPLSSFAQVIGAVEGTDRPAIHVRFRGIAPISQLGSNDRPRGSRFP